MKSTIKRLARRVLAPVAGMKDGVWEDLVSLNARGTLSGQILPPAKAFVGDDGGQVEWDRAAFPLDEAVERDVSVLPITAEREGYYGDGHFAYWASGLRDWCQISEWAKANGKPIDSFLDIGCASGRVIRHVHYQAGVKAVYGCDINRLHVDWVSRHLPPAIMAFQCTSIPSLPIESASLDAVSAFSVFTHVESLETAWLMEIRRVLKPGGIAWLTVHGDRTWREMTPHWPLHRALAAYPDFPAGERPPELPAERLVFRARHDRSYSSNTFYSYDYIHRHWGRFLSVRDIFPAKPEYQDVVVLQK